MGPSVPHLYRSIANNNRTAQYRSDIRATPLTSELTWRSLSNTSVLACGGQRSNRCNTPILKYRRLRPLRSKLLFDLDTTSQVSLLRKDRVRTQSLANCPPAGPAHQRITITYRHDSLDKRNKTKRSEKRLRARARETKKEEREKGRKEIVTERAEDENV